MVRDIKIKTKRMDTQFSSANDLHTPVDCSAKDSFPFCQCSACGLTEHPGHCMLVTENYMYIMALLICLVRGR